MEQNSARRGFTLIELLVVVIIIAILAAIALPQYQKAVMKARTAELQTFIANVEKAMDLYVLENGWPNEHVLWDKMDIDVSSYCDSVRSTYPFSCIAKNFSAEAPSGMGANMWYWVVYPSSSLFGSGYLEIRAYKDGTKEKHCNVNESLKAKPMCEALKASDPSWEIALPSGL